MAGSATWAPTINRGSGNPNLQVIAVSYTTDSSAGSIRASCPLSIDGMFLRGVVTPVDAHSANFDFIVRDKYDKYLAYRIDCTGTASYHNEVDPIQKNYLRGTFSIDVENAGNSKHGNAELYFGQVTEYEHIPKEFSMNFSAVGNETGDAKTTYVHLTGYPPSFVADVLSVVIHKTVGTAPTTYQAQLWSEVVDTYASYDASTYSEYKVRNIDADDQYKVIDAEPFTIIDHTGTGDVYGGVRITGTTTDDNYRITLRTRLKGIVE